MTPSKMEAGVILFPDTNIFLHYPPIKDIDWRAWVGSNPTQVKLVVCLTVIQELDKKKSGHSLQDRAKRAIKEIREYKSGKEVSPGVSLEIFIYEAKATDFPGTLSIDSMDDRIVHSVLKYRDNHPSEDARIVSEDMNMELRCEAHAIPHCPPDTTKRVTDPVDAQSKEIQKLRLENETLRNRFPKLALLVMPPGMPEPVQKIAEYTLIQWHPPAQSVEEEIEPLRLAYETRHGSVIKTQQVKAHLALTNQTAFSDYQNSMKDYWKKLQVHHEKSRLAEDIRSRSILFSLTIDNSGKAPANSVTVGMDFPPNVIIQEMIKGGGDPSTWDSNPFAVPPEPDLPAEPELRVQTGAEHIQELVAKIQSQVSNLRLSSTPSQHAHVKFPDLHRRLDVKLIDGTDQYTIDFWMRKLPHPDREHIGYFLAIFPSWQEAKTFQAKVHLHSEDLPDPIESQFVFKITKVEDPT